MLLPVKLQALACNFTKSNTSPWVFFMFLKIAQMVANRAKRYVTYSVRVAMQQISPPF